MACRCEAPHAGLKPGARHLMKLPFATAPKPRVLALTACLLTAVAPGSQGHADNPSTVTVEKQPSAPSPSIESASVAQVEKTPAPDLIVHFDPSAGTPAPPSRPKQVPMIVIVIIWLSIVTFWYLRRTRDPESPGR